MPVTRVKPGARGLAALVLGGSLLAVACSSLDSSTMSAGGGAMAAPPSSDGPPQRGDDSTCPGYDPPVVGTECRSHRNGGRWDGTCEYGHDLERRCNDVFECNTESTWRRITRSSCFGRCPGTFAEIVPGAPCDNAEMGCSYLEGTCACVAETDGPDAGDIDSGAPGGHWLCAPPPGNGCPAQRPSLRSDCVRPMECDYGSCALKRELVYFCDTGSKSWVQGSYPECD